VHRLAAGHAGASDLTHQVRARWLGGYKQLAPGWLQAAGWLVHWASGLAVEWLRRLAASGLTQTQPSHCHRPACHHPACPAGCTSATRSAWPPTGSRSRCRCAWASRFPPGMGCGSPRILGTAARAAATAGRRRTLQSQSPCSDALLMLPAE
jgi:hypothetical protein